MRQKTIALLMLGLCVLLAGAAAVIGVWHFGGGGTEEPSPAAEVSQALTTEEEEPEGKAIPAERVVPERDSAVIPARSVSAGEAYFADAAFLVNSVSMGLEMYDYEGLLSGADFYGEEELDAFDGVDYIRKMESGDYGKIYIGLGLNELSRDLDAVRACYQEMLEELMRYSDDSIIVLMSAPPVSAYKSSTNASYTRELVRAYNAMLLDLAEDWGVWYLDACSVLSDEEGYLPSEVTEDGMHFTPAWYKNWFALLAEHYVDDGTVETGLLPAEAEAEAAAAAAEESAAPAE